MDNAMGFKLSIILAKLWTNFKICVLKILSFQVVEESNVKIFVIGCIWFQLNDVHIKFHQSIISRNSLLFFSVQSSHIFEGYCLVMCANCSKINLKYACWYTDQSIKHLVHAFGIVNKCISHSHKYCNYIRVFALQMFWLSCICLVRSRYDLSV